MSNKFTWEEYSLPCLVPTSKLDMEKDVQKGLIGTNTRTTKNTTCNNHQDKQDKQAGEQSSSSLSSPSFIIRHLKQGATGARKTWPAAEVLLDYLIRRGGLRDLSEKLDDKTSTPHELNVMHPPSPELHIHHQSDEETKYQDDEPLRLLELGGGTGFLSIGLALALNAEQDSTTSTKSSSSGSTTTYSSKARIVCTDNDKATIKNMRFNISNQPKECHLNKTIKVSNLDWATDVGGTKFDKELRSQFQNTKMQLKHPLINKDKQEEMELQDPLCLVSHLIASDVHYGTTTLEPLSSIVSAVKLRNPHCRVIILCKERVEGQVSDLKHRIEEKMQLGLMHNYELTEKLDDFHLSVRNIVHDETLGLKLIEC